MKIQTQSIHFTADQKLLEFIQKKLDKLETFNDEIIGAEVFLRLEKGDNSRENKVVEIKLAVPGETMFASEKDMSFEAAADEAVEALKKQIQKKKEKQHANR